MGTAFSDDHFFCYSMAAMQHLQGSLYLGSTPEGQRSWWLKLPVFEAFLLDNEQPQHALPKPVIHMGLKVQPPAKITPFWLEALYDALCAKSKEASFHPTSLLDNVSYS